MCDKAIRPLMYFKFWSSCRELSPLPSLCTRKISLSSSNLFVLFSALAPSNRLINIFRYLSFIRMFYFNLHLVLVHQKDDHVLEVFLRNTLMQALVILVIGVYISDYQFICYSLLLMN